MLCSDYALAVAAVGAAPDAVWAQGRVVLFAGRLGVLVEGLLDGVADEAADGGVGGFGFGVELCFQGCWYAQGDEWVASFVASWHAEGYTGEC
jgi:hypothetical protein